MTSKTTRTLVAIAAASSLLAGPAMTVEASAAPAPVTVVAKTGSTGATVTRIQNDLYYMGFLKAKPNGVYAPATTAAVKAFQKAYRLPVTGVTDSKTYATLRQRSDAKRKAAAAAAKRPSRVVARPGDRNKTVELIQYRLAKRGYLPFSSVIGIYGPATTAAVKNFQRLNKMPVTGIVDVATWERIPSAKAVSMPRTTVKLDPRCYTGRTICVDKSARKMYWLVNGQLKGQWVVRVGRPSLPTREGTFSIYRKHTNWHSTLYDVDMPYTQFFSGGEAIHYSVDFQYNGYAGGGSHGCVNMRSKADARWLYNQTRIGDKVVVYA